MIEKERRGEKKGKKRREKEREMKEKEKEKEKRENSTCSFARRVAASDLESKKEKSLDVHATSIINTFKSLSFLQAIFCAPTEIMKI